jgi:hypothetical protein
MISLSFVGPGSFDTASSVSCQWLVRLIVNINSASPRSEHRQGCAGCRCRAEGALENVEHEWIAMEVIDALEQARRQLGLRAMTRVGARSMGLCKRHHA